MRWLLAVLALWPVVTQAQSVTLGEFQAAQTRFGTLQTFKPGRYEPTQLLYNGALVAEDHRVHILGAFARGGEAHDWAVIETQHGGNMCPVSYILLKVSAQGVVRTEPFGECTGGLRDVRLVPGGIEAELGNGSLLIDKVVYRFDGQAMTRTEHASAAPTGRRAGAGADVTRWLNTHPSEILRDPSEQLRFLQIMTRAEMDDLSRHISVASTTEYMGGWVFGRGCLPHQCNSAAGGWGIRVADGAVIALWGSTDWAIEVQRGPRALFSDPAVLSYFSGWIY